MLWFFATISAVLLNSIGKVLHRYILRDEDAIGYAFIWSLLSAIFYIPLLVIEPLSLPSNQLEWMGLFLGASIWLTINIVGFYSIKHTHLTLRAPLNATKLIFIMFFANIFLDESITVWKLAGTLFMFIGIFVLTWKKGAFKHLKEYGVRLTLLTALLTACVAIVDKFNMNNGISPAFYGMLMYLFPSIPLGIMTKSRLEGFEKMWKKKAIFVILAAVCYTGTYYFHMIAYTLADVTNVYPILQLTTLVAIVLGYVTLKEKSEIIQRFAGGVCMVLGSIIIILGA